MSDTERDVEYWPGFHGRVEYDESPLSEDEAALLRDLGAAGTTRRDFLKVLAAAGISLSAAQLLTGCGSSARQTTAGALGGTAGGIETSPVSLKVNGQTHQLDLDSRVSLLDALREKLNLTGTKKGCDHGQCGACTVLVGGERVLSCLTLAAQAEGEEIVTIEGLAHGDDLHPMQAAFIKHDGFQCGYCTPGQLMSGVACIKEGHAKTDGDIREWMSGNLCRCGAYPNIVAAIRQVEKSGFKS
ncbi:MAG: oxidoreductase [Phycisphaerales bacterium]|nr:oxidoreductase [Phycisphaerales bacterium]